MAQTYFPSCALKRQETCQVNWKQTKGKKDRTVAVGKKIEQFKKKMSLINDAYLVCNLSFCFEQRTLSDNLFYILFRRFA